MKKEVEFAFQDMQEALREYEPGYGHGVEVDYKCLQTVLRWAEKHGLVPDYAEGDRVRVRRSAIRRMESYWEFERELGTISSVHGNHLRIVWDSDPRLEPVSSFFPTRAVERVYE